MCGGVLTQLNRRNLNRIFIAVSCLIFLVALVGVPFYFHRRANNKSVTETPCDESLSVPLVQPEFLSNGSVLDGDDIYPPGYHITTDGTTRGCLCALKPPCVRKCCARDEHYVKRSRAPALCEKIPEERIPTGISPFKNFTIPVYKGPGELVEVDQNHFSVIHGEICQFGKFIVEPEDKLELTVDGTLRRKDTDDEWVDLDVNGYCLDYTNGSEELRVFVCFKNVDMDYETLVRFWVYPIAMMVSMPFLIATIVVYSIIPELRNLHGKSLSCQCACLLVAYICLVITQLKSDALDDFWCVFVAYMIQFMFLGSLFWLNAMSFDIWWSFSGLRPTRWGLKASEHQKFMLYSLYAWGVPLVIVGVTVAVEMTSGDPDSVIKPNIGTVKCWFGSSTATFLYFYLPSGIVLFLNGVMFVTTAMVLRSQTKKGNDQIRFHLYLKLFIVMGLNWTLELVSFFVGGPDYMWFVTDVCNILQGVVIFFIFVCKRSVLHKLNQKMCVRWHLFTATSPEVSLSLTKMEPEDLDQRTRVNNDESNHDDSQPQIT